MITHGAVAAPREPFGELGFMVGINDALIIAGFLGLGVLSMLGVIAWLLTHRRGALAQTPHQVRIVPARTLAVHTANLSPDTDEVIVIITLDADAFGELTLIDAPLRLTAPDSRPVTFVTGVSDSAPVLDPNEGWIIPVSDATGAELRGLPAGPGEHELTTVHVAFIVEP